MFNLFKSKKRVLRTIEAIHNEFDAAGQRLVEEAKLILSNQQLDEKGERLSKLGFTNSKAATKNKKIKEENMERQMNYEKKKEASKWVEYYGQWYPNSKFITKEIVEEICKKYNLLCGDVDRYTGDVPLKNVQEMEQFRLRQEDMKCHTELDNWHRNRQWDYARNMRSGLFGDPTYNPINSQLNPSGIARMSNQKYYSRESFQICAPETDFNTRGMSKIGKFLIPDPIVLQPVKGGYLIVTKWGLEASDELVVNEKQN